MTAKHYLKLGQNLRRLLFERNMKPIDLAREVKLPQPTIHRLVTGKSTRPYKSSLEPIADFFSVTIDDLLGEPNAINSIWEGDTKKNKNTIPSKLIKHIPIIHWDNITKTQKSNSGYIITAGNLSNDSFAVTMPDSSMEPFFMIGTLLIFDPNQNPKDRSYVLVNSLENNLYVFRQLLIDGNDKYLKPLNPDLNTFKIKALNKKDKILATLVESRNQYISHEPPLLSKDF